MVIKIIISYCTDLFGMWRFVAGFASRIAMYSRSVGMSFCISTISVFHTKINMLYQKFNSLSDSNHSSLPMMSKIIWLAKEVDNYAKGTCRVNSYLMG